MDFTNEKYEYMLHTWGGFYNPEYASIHGRSAGYYFFDTKEELDSYLSELKTIEEKLKAFSLATSIEEGRHVRYRTIATMKMIYKGKPYDYTHDFGYAYPVEAAHFMFKEGNYMCDCNRSLFLKRNYSDVQKKDCGHEIELSEFKVEQKKC